MSHHWYNTAAWRRRRKAQVIREPECRMCKAMGIGTPATETLIADHVEPHRGDRDKFWRGELQTLCKTHHDSTKQADEARGYSVAVGVDGMPIDDAHPANAYARRYGRAG